ncbi:ribonuclease M5 [Salisediminibacterium halotolerans]|uniref:Ribonuclease M5 n=1 Tax=Salisediminibacterium halotolerans TaxID=517425 RepID=A0A1H9VRQ3_9BACI|nr:ribonuclease M5 [Salisediminibacterium haloalkalitolerans]SES24219.1 ribonuclease M5 [Salisediminibacterium haloalkalitolerans]
MTRKSIKEIIVVEGKNDTLKLRRYFDCDTIETNGSAVSFAVIERVRLANARRGVIVFTDPDFPGGKIRQTIDDEVSGVKHAFLPKEAAKDEQKGKIGIEHAALADLQHALEHAKVSYSEEEAKTFVTSDDLLQAGLTAGEGARRKRERLGIILGIGYANAKQLEKRLRQFQISRQEWADAVNKLEKELRDDNE